MAAPGGGIDGISTRGELKRFVEEMVLGDLPQRVQRLQARPMARVYRTAVQSIPDQTETAIQFDAEDFDTGGFHDNGTNNTRLTIPKAGVHLVTANAQFDNLGAGTIESYLIVRKNGGGAGSAVGPFSNMVNTDSTADPGYSVAGMVELAEGDYLECFAYQDNSGGAAINIKFIAARSPVFTIAWLGGG